MTAWKLLPLFAVAAFAQDQTGGLRGTVQDSVTHQPVRNANVMLRFAGQFRGPQPRNGNQNPSANTGAGGTFSFDAVAAGPYTIIVQHPNYPQERPVQKRVEVKAGEITEGVNIDLIPGGAISGQVFDEDGDPLRGCNVQAHPAAHPERTAPGIARNSGDDGGYRLYRLAAGKYKVSVRCTMTPFEPRPFSAGPARPPSRAYPTQDSDAVIDVAPGSEKTGVDFEMHTAAVTQIHGRFSAAGGDWHGQQVNVGLHPIGSGERFPPPPVLDMQKGTFEFRQVFPGSYYVTAFTISEQRLAALERIEVQDKPAEVVLTLQHGVDVSGAIEIEGSNGNQKISPDQLNVQLIPEPMIGFGGSGTNPGKDGTFTIKSVLPMRYRVTVHGPGGFLKSAWLGNADVTGKVFDLSGGEPLKIVFSSNTATLNGTAPAGMTVLVSDLDVPSFRAVASDATGHFTVPGLAPGKYRVFASDSGMPPDDGGQEGQQVTLGEGETVTVDVKAPTSAQ